MAKNDGGLAFPQPMLQGAHGGPLMPKDYGVGGLSVRTYMATAFLAALVASDPIPGEIGPAATAFAEDAVKLADALLAELAKED